MLRGFLLQFSVYFYTIYALTIMDVSILGKSPNKRQEKSDKQKIKLFIDGGKLFILNQGGGQFGWGK